MLRHDYSHAVEITPKIYWVGFRESDRLLCNPYLLVDRECAILIDPGSIPDFPLMMRKVIEVVDPAMIELVVVQHQDPDVAGCLPVLEDVIARPDLQVAAHSNAHRLIQHLGFKASPYVVDERGWQYVTSTGDKLDFVYTPYAHSPGAIATYHAASRSLFTSDMFAAMSSGEDLFHAEDFPHSMDSFHQLYMPSNAVLRESLSRLSPLAIDRLLPQHGTVIQGDDIRVAFQHLAGLPCGIDLLPRSEPGHG